MAPDAVRIVLVTIFACFLSGSGSALRMEVSPNGFNHLLHESVNISCIVDGPSASSQDVIGIQIERPHDKPIVTIDAKHNLTVSTELIPSGQAIGNIDNINGRSYLTLMLSNPGTGDVGPYVCSMFFTDEAYQFNEARDHINVTMENEGIETFATFVLGKVSDLEDKCGEVDILKQKEKENEECQNDLKKAAKGMNETIQKHTSDIQTCLSTNQQQQVHIVKLEEIVTQQMEKERNNSATVTVIVETMKQQDNKIAELEDSLRQHMVDGQAHRAIVSDLLSIMNDMNQTIRQQSSIILQHTSIIQQHTSTIRQHTSTIEEHTSTIAQHNSTIQQQHARIVKLEETVKLLNEREMQIAAVVSLQDKSLTRLNATSVQMGKDVAQLIDKESTDCAFTMGYNPKDKLHNGKNMLFTETLSNVGNYYDPKTGIFTAPRDGLYYFNLVVMTEVQDWTNVYIRINGKDATHLHSEDRDTYDQTAVSIVPSLKTGDKVTVFLRGIGNKDTVVGNFQSMFSGFLVKVL